jgi:hypothetical protein
MYYSTFSLILMGNKLCFYYEDYSVDIEMKISAIYSEINSVTCYLLRLRIISGLRILYLNLLDVLGRITVACNTSNHIT